MLKRLGRQLPWNCTPLSLGVAGVSVSKITGTKFHDVDADGVLDAGEPGKGKSDEPPDAASLPVRRNASGFSRNAA